MRVLERQQLIAEMRAHLERDSLPRLTMLWILIVAGSVAFLTSAFALWAGLVSMPSRYALAVVCGYGGFLVMLRAWLQYRQGEWDAVDAWQRGTDLIPNPVTSWEPRDSHHFSLDLDDLWWLVLLIVAALGALATIAYVIYDAPMLLAEVALDAAVVSAGLRRTWLPATSLAVFMSIAGFALQHLVPHAHSIGDVLRAVVR